jgi:hypothetical protein
MKKESELKKRYIPFFSSRQVYLTDKFVMFINMPKSHTGPDKVLPPLCTYKLMHRTNERRRRQKQWLRKSAESILRCCSSRVVSHARANSRRGQPSECTFSPHDPVIVASTSPPVVWSVRSGPSCLLKVSTLEFGG